jgi:hypothetical protein
MNQRTCCGPNAIRRGFPIFTSEASYSTQILRPLIDNAQMLWLAGLSKPVGSEAVCEPAIVPPVTV